MRIGPFLINGRTWWMYLLAVSFVVVASLGAFAWNAENNYQDEVRVFEGQVVSSNLIENVNCVAVV